MAYFLIAQIEFSSKDIASALKEGLSSNSIYFLIFAVLLLPLNLWLEMLKWKCLLPDSIKTTNSNFKMFNGVIAGTTLGLLTPNRIGGFIGRYYVLNKQNLPTITISSLLGNTIQFSASVFFFFLFIVILNLWKCPAEFPFLCTEWWLYMLSLVGLFITSMFLINFKWCISLLIRFSNRLHEKVAERMNYLEEIPNRDLRYSLLYAYLRYLVFGLQLILLLLWMRVPIDLYSMVCFVGILYGMASIIPSAFLSNLGTRDAIALFILGGFNCDEKVLIVTLSIWLINMLIPAIVGYFILIKNAFNFKVK